MKFKEVNQAADQCVKCGLCLPVCPTYQLYQHEAESPRGRLALAQGLATGQLQWNKSSQQYLEHCIYCLKCQTICPSQVDYQTIIDTTKAQFSPTYYKKYFLQFITTPAILRFALKIAPFIIKRPKLIAQFETKNKLIIKNPQSQKKIGLFIGCISQFSDFKALQATCSILNLLNYQVIIPKQQGCCGAIFQHNGFPQKTADLAKKNQSAFKDCDTILTIATGCQRTLKESFINKEVMDAAVFIGKLTWSFKLKNKKIKVAVHRPCSEQTPSQILPRLKHIESIELTTTQCCGAGGMHLLTEPKQSQQLIQPLIKEIQSLNLDYIVTTNSGCRLNLASHSNLPVKHPIEILFELIQF